MEDLYQGQRIFASGTGYGFSGGTAAANILKHPGYALEKTPELWRFWKKGSFHREFELMPGESIVIKYPFKSWV